MNIIIQGMDLAVVRPLRLYTSDRRPFEADKKKLKYQLNNPSA